MVALKSLQPRGGSCASQSTPKPGPAQTAASCLFNAFVAVARLRQRRADLFNVLRAAGFQGEVDDRVAEADAVVGAVVGRLHDVGAEVGDDLREVMQGAGAVGEVDADPGAASVLDQAAFDDLREQGDVDVAAAHEDRGALAVEVGLFLEQRRQGCSTGAFGQGLFAFQQDEDGAGDLLFIDGEKFVDVFGDQRNGALASATDGDAVSDGGFSGNGDGMPGFARTQHRRQAFGLNADDPNLRTVLLDGAGDATYEAAAADGDDHGFEVGDLLQQLEADGTLPC